MAKKKTIYASINFSEKATQKIKEVKAKYNRQKINVSIEFVVNQLIEEIK